MKVILIGSEGKMGQKMQNLLKKHEISYLGIDKFNRNDANSYDADVILDFSSSECLEENLNLAKSKKIPIVIATTNHDEKNLSSIEDAKNEIPIFLSSNFSILFYILLKMLSQIENLDDCDFVVEETHHKHKKDSPSGSCKEILKILNNKNIFPVVSSYRIGEVVGIHNLKIYSPSESLEIKHQVFDRDVFCYGALKACEYIVTKNSGLYFMEDMLKQSYSKQS